MMKKLILILALAIFTTPACFASENYLAYAETNKNTTQKQIKVLEKEVKALLQAQIDYSNKYDIKSLKTVYANNYYSSDGFDKKTYFELVDKTWKLYPNIKNSMNVKSITIVGNTAIAIVDEASWATSTEKVAEMEIRGYLNSTSETAYYLEKVDENWVITASHIIAEETSLKYGEANNIKMELIVPQLVQAGKDYTASLKITNDDKQLFTIASIGQEKITYPQANTEESFRKLPENGILERILTANKDNLNEYTVASVGLTRAKVNKQKDIKLVVTGLGYIITRTNVISTKDAFSKVTEHGKEETTATKPVE